MTHHDRILVTVPVSLSHLGGRASIVLREWLCMIRDLFGGTCLTMEFSQAPGSWAVLAGAAALIGRASILNQAPHQPQPAQNQLQPTATNCNQLQPSLPNSAHPQTRLPASRPSPNAGQNTPNNAMLSCSGASRGSNPRCKLFQCGEHDSIS